MVSRCFGAHFILKISQSEGLSLIDLEANVLGEHVCLGDPHISCTSARYPPCSALIPINTPLESVFVEFFLLIRIISFVFLALVSCFSSLFDI